jgi:hypothetical protein
MNNKTLLIYALILFTLSPCNSEISDRIGSLNEEDLKIQVDTFQIHKRVSIVLETEKNFDFEDCQIMILINSSDVVFNGTYSELLNTKIPLPKPNEYSENQSGYLIGIKVYDLKNKLEYKWASDVTYFLDEKKKNKIKLLYTGIPEESITLNVEQIQ